MVFLLWSVSSGSFTSEFDVFSSFLVLVSAESSLMFFLSIWNSGVVLWVHLQFVDDFCFFPDCIDFEQLGPFKVCFPLPSFLLFWFEAGSLSSELVELVDMKGLLGTSRCFSCFLYLRVVFIVDCGLLLI